MPSKKFLTAFFLRVKKNTIKNNIIFFYVKKNINNFEESKRHRKLYCYLQKHFKSFFELCKTNN